MKIFTALTLISLSFVNHAQAGETAGEQVMQSIQRSQAARDAQLRRQRVELRNAVESGKMKPAPETRYLAQRMRNAQEAFRSGESTGARQVKQMSDRAARAGIKGERIRGRGYAAVPVLAVVAVAGIAATESDSNARVNSGSFKKKSALKQEAQVSRESALVELNGEGL